MNIERRQDTLVIEDDSKALRAIRARAAWPITIAFAPIAFQSVRSGSLYLTTENVSIFVFCMVLGVWLLHAPMVRSVVDRNRREVRITSLRGGRCERTRVVNFAEILSVETDCSDSDRQEFTPRLVLYSPDFDPSQLGLIPRAWKRVRLLGRGYPEIEAQQATEAIKRELA